MIWPTAVSRALLGNSYIFMCLCVSGEAVGGGGYGRSRASVVASYHSSLMQVKPSSPAICSGPPGGIRQSHARIDGGKQPLLGAFLTPESRRRSRVGVMGKGGGQSPFSHTQREKINLSQHVYRQDDAAF